MIEEDFIRDYVLRILREQDEEEDDLPKTSGPGRGRFKKELRDLKALADVNPGKLMSNLNISSPPGLNAESDLASILNAAAGGTKAMKDAYGTPKRMEDNYGRIGYSITVTGKGISSRDGLVFIRETFKGANGAGYWPWNEAIQIELLGGSILAYADKKTFSWNKKKKSRPATREGNN